MEAGIIVMRIVKASALALALSVSLGLGAAMAADAPAKSHGWFHGHHHAATHHICDFLKAIFSHRHHQKVVQVAY
jgi:hypothetical protein